MPGTLLIVTAPSGAGPQEDSLMIRSLMAVVASIVLVAGSAFSAFAQQGETMEQKYEAKVAESWFKDNGFTDDYDTARELATKTGKPIFAYFSRSYSG